MRFLIILTQLYLISCIIVNYTNINSNNRITRCLRTSKLDSFFTNHLNVKPLQLSNPLDSFLMGFSGKSDDYGRYNNKSDCNSESSDLFVKQHGLLVDYLPESHWFDFKNIHNKSYSSIRAEMAALRKWRVNLKRVVEHNRLFLAGQKSYSLHLNHFGDLSVADYFKNILKHMNTIPLFDPFEDRRRTALSKTTKCKTPKQVDWRKRGYRPRREEQWKCGACYAFAVTHALQAQLYKAHKLWGELSPQQIVDCSSTDGNKGCDGGSLRGALRYVAREGLAMETNYPYIGKQGTCKSNPLLTAIKPRRWAMLPPGDEDAMERALASIGPLPVAVNAAPFTFQLYRSGIYDDPFCTGWILNHAMLLIGYTPEYWILLNWWGTNWGEDGYMRIRRGINICGVANMAAYVEL